MWAVEPSSSATLKVGRVAFLRCMADAGWLSLAIRPGRILGSLRAFFTVPFPY